MVDNGHILIVDDEPELCALIADYLTGEGYRVSTAHNGGALRHAIARGPVDLVLLDVMLPGEDGLSLARGLRADGLDIGIVMLTGRGDTIDRIIGLEMGADDYVAKPFHLRELLARVKSVLRRRAMSEAGSEPPASQIEFAGWRLDRAGRELFSPAGEKVRLTSGEFDLLVVFVSNPNRVLSRERLLALARDRAAGPFDRTIDVQVGRLRRKIETDPQRPQLIKTVRGGGYIFSVAVEFAAEQRVAAYAADASYCTSAPGAGQ